MAESWVWAGGISNVRSITENKFEDHGKTLNRFLPMTDLAGFQNSRLKQRAGPYDGDELII